MKKQIRKICIVTGTRAEYGLLRPIMYAIKNDPHLKLQLLVTGTHLDKKFGATAKYILDDGFKIDAKVVLQTEDNSSYGTSLSIGEAVFGVTKSLKELKPDVVLVLGDRFEILATSVATVYSGIPLAHIHGGDSAEAGLDENARHAITKLANIHFPATKKSAQRIFKMGEDKYRIFITGAPGIDDIERKNFTDKKEIYLKFNLDKKQPLLLVVQHPVTTEIKDATSQIKETLEAIVAFKLPTIIIYPNSDAGGLTMIRIIEDYYKKNYFIKTYKSIERRDYLGLLNVATVLLGNSSSAIIESSSFGIPAIDIGTRQKGREGGNNLLFADYNRKEIIKALHKCLTDKNFLKRVQKSKNPYSGGGTGLKIAKILKQIKLDSSILKKKITY